MLKFQSNNTNNNIKKNNNNINLKSNSANKTLLINKPINNQSKRTFTQSTKLSKRTSRTISKRKPINALSNHKFSTTPSSTTTISATPSISETICPPPSLSSSTTQTLISDISSNTTSSSTTTTPPITIPKINQHLSSSNIIPIEFGSIKFNIYKKLTVADMMEYVREELIQLKQQQSQLSHIDQTQKALLATLPTTSSLTTTTTTTSSISNQTFESMSKTISNIEDWMDYIDYAAECLPKPNPHDINCLEAITHGNVDTIYEAWIGYKFTFKHLPSISGGEPRSFDDALGSLVRSGHLTDVEIQNIGDLVDIDGNVYDSNGSTWNMCACNDLIRLSWKNTIKFDCTTNIPTLPKFTTNVNIVQPVKDMLYDIDEISEQHLIIHHSDIFDITPVTATSQSTIDEPSKTKKQLSQSSIRKSSTSKTKPTQRIQSTVLIEPKILANKAFRPHFIEYDESDWKSYSKYVYGNPLADVKLKWELKESLSTEQKELITALSPILSQNYKSHKERSRPNGWDDEKVKFVTGLNIEIENVQITYHIDHDIDITKSLSDLTYNLPRATKQSLLLHQYNTIHISSPSILNGQWIEIQGDNAIASNDFRLHIGSFITNNNETIKLKWSNSKYNNIQQEFIQRLSTSLLHNYQQYQLPHGRKSYKVNNLITNSTNEYYLDEIDTFNHFIYQKHKKQKNVFISSPSVLNGEWIQIKGDDSIIGDVDNLRLDQFLHGQNIVEPIQIDSNDVTKGMKFMCGTIKFNDNPIDIPLEPQQATAEDSNDDDDDDEEISEVEKKVVFEIDEVVQEEDDDENDEVDGDDNSDDDDGENN